MSTTTDSDPDLDINFKQFLERNQILNGLFKEFVHITHMNKMYKIGLSTSEYRYIVFGNITTYRYHIISQKSLICLTLVLKRKVIRLCTLLIFFLSGSFEDMGIVNAFYLSFCYGSISSKLPLKNK